MWNPKILDVELAETSRYIPFSKGSILDVEDLEIQNMDVGIRWTWK